MRRDPLTITSTWASAEITFAGLAERPAAGWNIQFGLQDANNEAAQGSMKPVPGGSIFPSITCCKAPLSHRPFLQLGTVIMTIRRIRDEAGKCQSSYSLGTFH